MKLARVLIRTKLFYEIEGDLIRVESSFPRWKEVYLIRVELLYETEGGGGGLSY